jgi:hypothetical protein
VPVPYTDIGGGGPNPPHGEDFFNRIVNVHWPKKKPDGGVGGLYMSGDHNGYINTSPVFDPDKPYDSRWQVTRTPPPLGPDQNWDSTSNIYAIAYGGLNPKSSVFVYAALTYVFGTTAGYGNDISYSIDGSNWIAAAHPWENFRDLESFEIIGMTYDKSTRTFHVAVWHSDYTGVQEAWFDEIILGKSSDGKTFTQTSRQTVWVYGQVPDGYPGEFAMPAADYDQIVVSDSTKTVLRNSAPPVYHWRYKEFFNGGTISRIPGPDAEPNHDFVPPPGFNLTPTVEVNSIAWSNGVWVVGGWGGVNVSYDDGLSWTDAGVAIPPPGQNFVAGVAAGNAPPLPV